ncbi:transcriptional regulator GlxA family with amidase domain [Pseudomonas sp. JUb42]|jgi:transcriptional regulator GlxA family with amidase domain|uniref:GlxA family transcriptional regulator n=1 Tax=Pseudomonas sp. JUb42 TaxID=2940611 RepID=UPI0021680B6E|nr:GlxA family transcriptional regulator [Pseudomonas sp. JUb42]MCS3468906.1 transcriptional regulator GlxA family with amidase domain [Pseudomonas sp. JUb42]
MITVGLVVYPEFQTLGLGLLTVFEYANILSGHEKYSFEMVSVGGGPIKSSAGAEINTTSFVGRSFDTLILIGDNHRAPASPELLTYLSAAPNHCRRIAAVCTGAFILAAAGLLDGKRATTHWQYTDDLGREYPTLNVDGDRIFVIDGQIWTSAGMSAGIDLALALVEKDFGSELAKMISRKLVLYHRRAGGQSQFSALLEFDAKSDRVQSALSYARNNLGSDLSIEVLANEARLSARQFSRVFRAETGQSPAKAVERLRVEAARLMMETTRHPIDIIARETGFGDRDRMRQSFLRAFGKSPQTIQRLSQSDEII